LGLDRAGGCAGLCVARCSVGALGRYRWRVDPDGRMDGAESGGVVVQSNEQHARMPTRIRLPTVL